MTYWGFSKKLCQKIDVLRSKNHLQKEMGLKVEKEGVDGQPERFAVYPELTLWRQTFPELIVLSESSHQDGVLRGQHLFQTSWKLRASFETDSQCLQQHFGGRGRYRGINQVAADKVNVYFAHFLLALPEVVSQPHHQLSS